MPGRRCYWHWAFLAQPAPLPERLIAADPDAFSDFHVRALGFGRAPGRYPAQLMALYRGLLDDASTVQAICEDYRAGATVDRRHDDHFLVEDEPTQIADALCAFLEPYLPALTPSPERRPMSTNAVENTKPADALAATLKRTETLHRGSSIPGRDIVQVRTEIPAGVASGWHTHPGEEVGNIIAGTVQMEILNQPTLILHPGDGFLIPPRTPHNALYLGPDTGLMLSTYLVEVGEPIATFTD